MSDSVCLQTLHFVLFCLEFVEIERNLKEARTQGGDPRERQFFSPASRLLSVLEEK